MTLLAIDPGTHSMGWAVYRDSACVADGVLTHGDFAPSALLRSVRAFLDDLHTGVPLERVVCERMFVNALYGGNSARLLNVLPDEIEAWCREFGVTFVKYTNSQVKKAVTGDGHADKAAVLAAMRPNISADLLATLTIKPLYDVADAHAIAWTDIVRRSRQRTPA